MGEGRRVGTRDLDRRRRRADALRRHAEEYARANNELRRIHDEGERLRSQVLIRRTFILARRDPGQSGDATPSSAVALATQKGWALHLYLIAILEAQSRRRSGGVILNRRPLRSTDQQVGWVDLLPATTGTADQAAGMLRQMKRALTQLAQHNLVELSLRRATAGRFEGFQLLNEAGMSYGLPIWDRYTIPAADSLLDKPGYLRSIVAKAARAEALSIPTSFFLNGWAYVLSPAEILTYLMIRELETRFPRTGQSGVYVTGATRLDWYGISRDVYESHHQLASYGLIERIEDPNRRPDGKILRRPGGGQQLQPLRFRTLPQGLKQPALEAVISALR